MIFNLFIALALMGSIQANLRGESNELHVPDMNILPTSLLSLKTELDDSASGKVVGGTETAAGRYPYFVWANGCGGMLIGKDIVLTAAHCNSIWSGTVYINIFKGNQQGINQCGQSGDGSNCEKFNVKSKLRHPDYSSQTIDYDYLLVKLDGMSDKEPVLIVEDDDNISNNNQITTLGFGTTSSGGTASTKQLEATVGFKDASTCGNNYGYSSSDITPRMNCGYTRGKDACQGDSGGPFVKKGSASDGSDDILVGIVSWGNGCALNNFPGVYADVLNQRSWIVTNACDMTDVPGTCTIGQRGPANPSIPTTPMPSPAPVVAPVVAPTDDGGDDYFDDDYYYDDDYELLDCSGISNWKRKLKYTKGKQVKYFGELFECKKTTKKKNPYSTRFWTSIGFCASPCDNVNDWNKKLQYQKGDQAVWNNKLYTAKKSGKNKKPKKKAFWNNVDWC